jgi:enamine deaminase RidA (YjgF/YER057c/UK114 family)
MRRDPSGSEQDSHRVGIDPNTGKLAGNTMQAQTQQALTNCTAILEAGGADLDDVIDVGILLTDPADVDGLNEEYANWFPSEPPARCVGKLGVDLPDLLVSIRTTAYVASRSGPGHQGRDAPIRRSSGSCSWRAAGPRKRHCADAHPCSRGHGEVA